MSRENKCFNMEGLKTLLGIVAGVFLMVICIYIYRSSVLPIDQFNASDKYVVSNTYPYTFMVSKKSASAMEYEKNPSYTLLTCSEMYSNIEYFEESEKLKSLRMIESTDEYVIIHYCEDWLSTIHQLQEELEQKEK